MTQPKTRLMMLCPCCGGEVTHQTYSFTMMCAAPLRMSEFYVCDTCETALSGTDAAARAAVEQAFVDYLQQGGVDHAPAT